MPQLAEVFLNEVAPTGQIAQTAPADICCFIGCASSGNAFQIYDFGAQALANIVSTFTNGPLCAEGGYDANKVPVPTVFVRVPATAVSAASSAVTYTGTGTAASFVVGGTIADGWDIVIKVTTGGTIGTSFSTSISLDGGATFSTPVANATALAIAITGAYNGVTIATGITLTLTTSQTLALNDTIAFWTQPASASILTTTVTRVLSSTSTLVFSGTPADAYHIVVQFLTSGTEGVGNTITFWVSLDGGLSFGGVQQLNTGGTYLIPDGAGSSGVTITVGSGTITALDMVSAKTTAPVPAFADVQTAKNAVRNWSGSWSFFHLTGYSSRAMRDSIEGLDQTYAVSGRFTWTSLSARDRITGENVHTSANNVAGDQAWTTRVAAEWGTSIGNRTPPLAGSVYCTSPIGGSLSSGSARQNRRPNGVAYTPRVIGISPDTAPGDRSLPNDGACSSDILITVPTSGIIAPQNPGALSEHDGRLNPMLINLGFNICRTYFGETGLAPGVYLEAGYLMSSPTDIQLWAWRRVLNLADSAMFAEMGRQLLSRLPINPATQPPPYNPGDIDPIVVNNLTSALFNAVRDKVRLYVSAGGAANGKGGITVTVNPTPGTSGGNPVVFASAQLVGKKILGTFSAGIGFTNPSLTAITTGA